MTEIVKKILFLCLLCLCVIAQSQQTKLRVAVLDPTTSGLAMDDGTKLAVQELISSAFVNTGKYTIIERSMIDKIIKEQSFQSSDMADNSQATEIGKLAGANKIVLSAVSLVGGRNMLSIKIIDVKTASIDKQKARLVASTELLDIVEALTLELLGEKPINEKKQQESERKLDDSEQLQMPNDFSITQSAQTIPPGEIGSLMTFPDGSQGIVFYKNGEHGLVFSRDGEHFSWQDAKRSGDCIDVADIPNDENDYNRFIPGLGAKYTAAMRQQLGTSCRAVDWCVKHGDGWYLPSAGELARLGAVSAMNLVVRGYLLLGDGPLPLLFGDNWWMWSSSEANQGESIKISLMGRCKKENKTKKLRIRAMRAF